MVEVSAGNPIYAIGVMTGTSMDEVDVAMIRTDGETIDAFLESSSYPISENRRDLIQHAIKHLNSYDTETLKRWKLDAAEKMTRRYVPHWLNGIDDELLEMIDYAVEGLTLPHGQIDNISSDDERRGPRLDRTNTVLGVHGQTVLHRPGEAFTLQIAMPRKDFRVGVGRCIEITDFRTADMEAGGQGAPLAPFYHFALAKHIGATEPLAFLNIGGVGNITWVDPTKLLPEEEGALIAFDTGPGNALVNDWMQAQTGELLDRDGALAAEGRVHRDRLATNSGQAYMDRRPPKSLDRNDFHGVLAAMEGLSTEDGAATLTAFTADTVAQSLKHMPSPPSRWLICGGGRHNKTMMRMLADRLKAPVDPVEAVGLDGDMLEAQAFAYLAVRVLRGLPTSAPSTTGCREPVCGGRISYPS